MTLQAYIRRKRRNYGNRCQNLRHRLIDYPIDRIERHRPRVFETRGTASSIPRVLVQTYRSDAVVRPVRSAVTRWQETNPEFEYRFFDDEEARDFIKDNYPPDVVEAFDALVPGAYKADLWRYCYLAAKGGVYADIRMEPLLGLRTILGFAEPEPPAFVGVRDLLNLDFDMRAYLYNAFMAAEPQHPVVLATLERTLAMIGNRDYGRNALDITGPGCLGAAFNTVRGRPIDEPIELGDQITPELGRYRILNHVYDPYHREVVALSDRPAIVTKCIHGDMWNADRTYARKSYGRMYSDREVFR